MPKRKPVETSRSVEALTHREATRKHIPTAEHESVMEQDDRDPIPVAYQRRNRDLDPQLVWRGKDERDASGLVVQSLPLFIQEKVHAKVLVDDLLRRSQQARAEKEAADQGFQPDLYADFNGLPNENAKTEFYRHDANWSNRMILGDSLLVMTSLAEREGLRGKVQCIYFDPPYGIKFNSNFQWSTTSRDVKDGKLDHVTREPEQVKAFRDTWRDGIHSYLTYLRDRLTVARDLLAESGSIFVQIGDENVHRIRLLMDEVFGEGNAISTIIVSKTSSQPSSALPTTCDIILWYARERERVKYRQVFVAKAPNTPESSAGEYKKFWRGFGEYLTEKQARRLEGHHLRRFRPDNTTSQSVSETSRFQFSYNGTTFLPGAGGWKTNRRGLDRLAKSDRLMARDKSVSYVRFLDDFPAVRVTDLWSDVRWGFDASEKRYVVETNPRVIQRCLLMATDPGDLVLDPTCGSGTTACVAEQWGRRWITIDTSRVALALARARIMGACYPFYLLADSRDGQIKEAEITHTVPSSQPVQGKIRQGFVYERVPHITLKSIANNAEIDVIWETFQKKLEPLREKLNTVLKETWQEWEIPRTAGATWSSAAQKLHADWWTQRIERQKEMDASIAEKADYEYLYDKPYEDNNKVRVAGPFTVESLLPHRVLGVGENDELLDSMVMEKPEPGDIWDFAQMILANLKTAGVQQAHKEDRITFTSLDPWPGHFVCADGRYREGGSDDDDARAEKRAAIFIGPEFGTVARPDLVAAAREAAESGFDVLIACAFNYDAHSSEFEKLGRIPVLKARMNADLHMADTLKNTGQGNLFVIFGEPDVEILEAGNGQIQVRIKGVDVFHPNSGEVRSAGPDGIACWFVDTDYNEESFFVRHAYFLGARNSYKDLKNTLKSEIDEEAWATLHSDTSRPFDKPTSGRIAVKVINHLGDEVMRVFRIRG